MAGPVKLTEVDFEQIKQNLINYLKSTNQFTDFDFDGSNLQVILNLIAYQSQLNAYSTNMIANESFLASSSIRSNVVENANLIGYLPTSVRSSVTEVSVQFSLSDNSYPQGFPTFLEVKPGAVVNAGEFTFNTIDTQVAPVLSGTGEVKFNNMRLNEGVLLKEDFTVDDSIYNQRFYLKNKNVDTTTVRVEIQEDPSEDTTIFYNQANNLVKLTEESRSYWIEETRDEIYELKFGDGYFGKKLANGSKILVTYLVSNGNLANGMQNVDNFSFVGEVFDSFGAAVSQRPNITRVTMSDSGTEKENSSSIKLRAPKYYAAQNRCVVDEDYEVIIRNLYSAVEDIYVFGGETLDIPQYGRVYVAVKPTHGDALSTLTKNYLKKSLNQYRIASIDIVFVDPEVLHIELVSTAYYDERKTIKDHSLIKASIKESLNYYKTSSTISKFGGAMRFSNIASIIDDADASITRNNTIFRLRKDIKPVMNGSASYEICFTCAIEQQRTGPAVYSSGFKLEIDGVASDRTYYFEDDANGKLFSFYFNKKGERIIDNENFGTINYETGDIYLGYDKAIKIIDVTTNNSMLEVRAKPATMDIIAKESVFLTLDIANSVINVTADNNIAKS